MSVINEIIPERYFEKVRDAIGAVIKTELENQKALQNFDDEINVFIGRNTPPSESERLVINVTVDSAAYTSFNEFSKHGNNTFFIDVYVSSASTDSNTGGLNSTITRDKFVGMIDYILSDHRNCTLQLPKGAIMGTAVEGFENFNSANNQDSTFSKMSRLTFTARLNESQGFWAGVEISSIFTDIKLELTQKGYKLEFQN